MIEFRNIPSYRDLQKGRHPDIPASVAARMTKEEQRLLAIHLTQRDLFTPLCVRFSEQVLSLDENAIRKEAANFSQPIYSFPFANSFEWLDQQHTDIYNAQSDYYDTPAYLLGKDSDELATLANVIGVMHFNTNPIKVDKAEVWDSFPGRFSSFVYAATEIARSHRWETLFVPVGAYGEETARKILMTGRIMLRLGDTHLAADAKAMAKKYGGLLSEITARASEYEPRKGKAKKKNSYYPLLTFEEGVESLLGGIGVLLPERIHAIEDGDEAVRIVVSACLPNLLAGSIPMGFLMPRVRAGRYFPGILSTDSGKPTISTQALDYFEAKLKESKYDHAHPELRYSEFPGVQELFERTNKTMVQLTSKFTDFDPDDIVHLTNDTDYGCPVARKSHVFRKSGIEMLCDSFLRIYSAL